MTGILETLKKLLGGGDENYTYFDSDILIHANTVFVILRQLGVGPSNGFMATKDSQWTDFLGDSMKLELVKTYVYLKVKLIFDPPSSSAAIEAMNRQADELEWRILAEVDPGFTPVLEGEGDTIV